MQTERPGPLEYSRKLWLRLWLAATFLFLYAPIAILILFSFNDSPPQHRLAGLHLRLLPEGLAERLADRGVRQQPRDRR